MDILSNFSTRATPQQRQADPRQEPNAAGGFTFPIDDWVRVQRFLTLGTDGGTYYASAGDLTVENAEVIVRAAAADPVELVRRIVAVSDAGRAPKQNPALFALAIAAACDDEDGRRAALAALPAVARTGTHLFLFAGYVEQFRGWGRALRRAVADWYLATDVDRLAYQLVKYRRRGGWSHRDLLRLAHPGTEDPRRAALFDWAVRPDGGAAPLPALVETFAAAQHATTAAEWVRLIDRGAGLSWEMLPDAALGHAGVWAALLAQGIPQTALLRQLPRLTRLGLAQGETGREIAGQLADADRLARARVHPINVLVAQRTYASGHSGRGDTTWTPALQISDALDAAFYAAFGGVEPTGKRTLLALDISGSMAAPVSDLPLTCREVSGALALVTAAIEPQHRIVGFTAKGGNVHRWDEGAALTDLDISPRRRLDDNLRAISDLPFGATDCALPMVWAREHRLEFDVFTIYTGNETWYGDIHPHQALRAYRETMGIDARLAVVAMTASHYSIADPADPGQLDVSGFDAAVPGLLSTFARGEV